MKQLNFLIQMINISHASISYFHIIEMFEFQVRTPETGKECSEYKTLNKIKNLKT